MSSTSKHGVWIWDVYNNAVSLPKEGQGKTGEGSMASSRLSRISTVISITTSISARKNIQAEIKMMDTVDAYKQTKFRKHCQRKVKVHDKAVATIQDVKDVAIFTTKVDDLFPEFISFFHTVAMDRFLRSMIVYFQYYFQVWDKMKLREKEASRKLRQPIVTELENEVMDNLSDLRSMVSRDYAAILLGMGDAKKFHHMSKKDNNSLSDKDRRLFELLIFMTTKVVWIALFRKLLVLIEKETNRLFRTFNYSPIEHSGISTSNPTPEEQRVLIGSVYQNERKLLHRSPAIQEIIFKNHDYKLLSIGICDIPGADERLNYLEIAYAAPEELLVDAGIAVGVLGVERKCLDPMLKPKKVSTTVKRTTVMKIGEFKIPPKSPIKNRVLSEVLPCTQCKFQESEATQIARESQCKKWRTYLDLKGIIYSEVPVSEDSTEI